MSLPTATSSFLGPVSGIIPPSNPPTCQVELEDPGKAYEAVIGSVGSNFEDIHCVGDPTGPLKRDHPKSVVVGDIQRAH
jgi:hypothetical protein